MKNRLPHFVDKHKICIICEGNEEYFYLCQINDVCFNLLFEIMTDLGQNQFRFKLSK